MRIMVMSIMAMMVVYQTIVGNDLKLQLQLQLQVLQLLQLQLQQLQLLLQLQQLLLLLLAPTFPITCGHFFPIFFSYENKSGSTDGMTHRNTRGHIVSNDWLISRNAEAWWPDGSLYDDDYEYNVQKINNRRGWLCWRRGRWWAWG